MCAATRSSPRARGKKKHNFERRPPVWLSSALPRRRRARPRPDGRLARVPCASRDPARARGAGAPHLQPSRARCVRATPATIPARPLSHSTPACHAKVHDPNLPATNTQPLHTTHRSTRRALCPIRRPLTAHTTPAQPAPSHSAHNQGLPTIPRPMRAPQSGQTQHAIHRLPRAQTAHKETRPIPDARSSSSPQPGTPSPLPHTPRQNPSHNPPFGARGYTRSALKRAPPSEAREQSKVFDRQPYRLSPCYPLSDASVQPCDPPQTTHMPEQRSAFARLPRRSRPPDSRGSEAPYARTRPLLTEESVFLSCPSRHVDRTPRHMLCRTNNGAR